MVNGLCFCYRCVNFCYDFWRDMGWVFQDGGIFFKFGWGVLCIFWNFYFDDFYYFVLDMILFRNFFCFVIFNFKKGVIKNIKLFFGQYKGY